MQGPNSKPHYQVTAGLIRDNERVLIARRPKGSHLEGFWEFPGGKQEPGENLRECLEREIEEELGLKVSAGRFLRSVDHDYGTKRVSLHFFDCIRVAGEPLPLQGQELRWVKIEDLKRFNFPPPDMEVVESLPTLVGDD